MAAGRPRGVPYSLRNGLEDVLAVNARMRLMLAETITIAQAALRASEAQAELLGQIRNGSYDPEQRAAPRLP
jgi:hypothetical protein